MTDDYREVFGASAEPWREPLGALRLTLADQTAPYWQVERARAECEALVKALNESAAEHDRQVADETARRVWAEAARVARSYDAGWGTVQVTIAEEFESYAASKEPTDG